MFSYPVTLGEIKLFLDQPFKETQLSNELEELLDAGLVHKMNNFYALKHDYSLVERRITGNADAVKKLKLAAKIARFLSWFPYVKGVAVSGSLSKNFAYKGSDIDFFIITAPNRLWIARMFFILFLKPLSFLGLKNWFCLNYLIDTTAVEIPEKNIYTAIEIATLMPRQGRAAFDNFFRANKWIHNYLPNYLTNNEDMPERKGPFLKKLTEWLLNNSTGDRIDDFFMRFYKERWRKMLEEKRFMKNGFQFGSYIAGKHVCKPVPQNFQGKLLKKFDEKLAALDDIYCTPHEVAV